ncbi:putative hemolysin [Inquilinus ginsengisoli]|uniref:hemolysin family protein n=1 Tax=Inquilinus ginsengisoli TaxID=363840 RepID=UPI003D2410F9
MSDIDGNTIDILKIIAVFLLVFANGFFVAAEFSLVAIRRSRVTELVAQRRANAGALKRAVDRLDSHLAATQLGITISSLALGWIGEPALAHLIEPLLQGLPASIAESGSHAIAVAIAFFIITALHIVLGELAPKSLALQRSEVTALWVVRPLSVFLFLFRPAILFLNGLGNGVLRLAGLQPGTGEEMLHSPEELRLIVAQSREAGLLDPAQQEYADRILSIGTRRVRDIMTSRPEVEWIDADDSREEILKTIRACRHEQLLVSRGSIDEIVGVVRKQDLLDQVIDGQPLDPLSTIRDVVALHEATPVLKVMEQFKSKPVRLAVVMDEYGTLEGIVTQTDLLEAIAGEIPEAGEEPGIVMRADGSYLIDGLTSAAEAFDRLHIRRWPEDRDFNTVAGFALHQFGRLPAAGDRFSWEGWRFEVVDMDGRRVDKLLASAEADRKQPASG